MCQKAKQSQITSIKGLLLKNQIKYTQVFPKRLWSISNIRTIMRLHTKYLLWPSKVFRGRKDYRAISFCSQNFNSTYLAKDTNHEKPLVCNLLVYDACHYKGACKMFPDVDWLSKTCIQAKGEYFEWQGRIKGSKINE